MSSAFGINPQTLTQQSVPPGYFNMKNVLFIQNAVADVLNREFVQRITVPPGDIVRIMQRVIEERLETIPRMNQRVIMYLTNEFRNHQIQRDKHMRWEEFYVQSQRLYDPTVGSVRTDPQTIKLPNRLGKLKVGGTQRFYFT